MSKKYVRTIFILFCLLLNTTAHAFEFRQRHAISYQGGDRFGDRMLVYAQARYLSYLTSVPFLVRPFIYSDQLTIDEEALPFDQFQNRYVKQVVIQSFASFNEFLKEIDSPITPPTLFILDYLPTDISEWDPNPWMKILFNVPWQEAGFHAYLKKVASCRNSIPNLRKEGVLNVADHVRTLSGTDTPETSIAQLPLKHPNLRYHKNQIRRIYELNKQRPMFVFIFSDTKNPHQLIAEFQQEFRNFNIEFGIQYLDQPDTNFAVQDFFAMQKFDVLIATQSNFSTMASRIGDFDLILTPICMRGVYPNAQVDRVQLISKKSDWFPYDLNLILRED